MKKQTTEQETPGFYIPVFKFVRLCPLCGSHLDCRCGTTDGISSSLFYACSNKECFFTVTINE